MSTDRLQTYATDPLAFVADLVIPSAHGPMRFGDCWADFQREWFQAVAPSLVAVARGERPPIGRFWVERTKGGSKDSDAACCLLWLLAFTRRPLEMQVGAADQDQADELRKAARDILRLNPWLATRIEVQSWRILCDASGSVCEIIAADTAGSHGARPDVLILNELSHITKQEFAENLFDNSVKVPHGLAIIATNAGFLDTWQRRWRDLAAESDRWIFHRWDKPAPWLDPAEIDEARRRNSRSRYLRLWEGVWATGAGDALDPDDIVSCTDDKLGPMYGDESDFLWVAGLDLGLKKDRSALCCLGVHQFEQRSQLASCEVWSPGPDGLVNLEQVRLGVLQAAWQFPGLTVGYDPHQCQYMATTLRREGVRMIEMPFSGRTLPIMAACVLQAFRSRTIRLYNDRELIRDLGRLSIVEKSYGYRLEATRDKSGHADRATGLAIALAMAGDAIGQYVEPVADNLGEYLPIDLS